MSKITLLAYFLLPILASAQSQMDITEQLINGTIRIEANNGNKTSIGTGFYFTFGKKIGKDSITVPVIITNKHVVNGFKDIKLFFKQKLNDKPDYNKPLIINIVNDTNTVVQHPDIKVDLVAIPIAPILIELNKNKIDLFYISADNKLILSDSIQKQELKSIEDVIMIGYPSGLWDLKNNLPIVRKGITATTPFLDYNGKREFLVDIAAFGGSSGSPIFINRDMYMDKQRNVGVMKPQLILLGILYGGPLYTVDGKLEMSNLNEPNQNFKSKIPMNLGYVIKASELWGFESVFFNQK